jgi:hypothetical protein
LFNATFFLSWGLAGTLVAGPLVDGLLHLGYAAETAYRWSYIAAVLITLAGFALLAVLVFLMMPRNTHSVNHETLVGRHRPRH